MKNLAMKLAVVAVIVILAGTMCSAATPSEAVKAAALSEKIDRKIDQRIKEYRDEYVRKMTELCHKVLKIGGKIGRAEEIARLVGRVDAVVGRALQAAVAKAAINPFRDGKAPSDPIVARWNLGGMRTFTRDGKVKNTVTNEQKGTWKRIRPHIYRVTLFDVSYYYIVRVENGRMIGQRIYKGPAKNRPPERITAQKQD